MNAQPAGPALPGLMTARIAAGLVKAQAHAKATERRGVSGDGTYKYATADDLVADGKEALAAGGLSLLVYGLFFEDGGKVICRSATLVHESGDCLAVGPLRWPVVSDRGRPMDKAVATAMTSSLGYMFRDLLCIPRTTADGADMDARQDHAPAEQKAPEKTTEGVFYEVSLLVGSRETEDRYGDPIAVPSGLSWNCDCRDFCQRGEKRACKHINRAIHLATLQGRMKRYQAERAAS